MKLWKKRHSWEEWRRLSPQLTEEKALLLFQQEESWWNNYEAEIINLTELRQQNLTDRIDSLASNLNTTITQGGGYKPPLWTDYYSVYLDSNTDHLKIDSSTDFDFLDGSTDLPYTFSIWYKSTDQSFGLISRDTTFELNVTNNAKTFYKEKKLCSRVILKLHHIF